MIVARFMATVCFLIKYSNCLTGDRGSTVVEVLCYKSKGRDPSWCQWIFH